MASLSVMLGIRFPEMYGPALLCTLACLDCMINEVRK